MKFQCEICDVLALKLKKNVFADISRVNAVKKSTTSPDISSVDLAFNGALMRVHELEYLQCCFTLIWQSGHSAQQKRDKHSLYYRLYQVLHIVSTAQKFVQCMCTRLFPCSHCYQYNLPVYSRYSRWMSEEEIRMKNVEQSFHFWSIKI